MQAATLDMWRAVRKDYIQSRIDSKRDKTAPEVNHLLSIADSEIDLTALVAIATSKGNGKLSGAAISEWCRAIGAVIITARLIAKGIEDDSIISSQVAAYEELFKSLASPKPDVKPNEYKALASILADTEEGDQMAERLDAVIKRETAPKAAASRVALLDI